MVRVLTDWNLRINRPQGSTRIRLYPQQLVYDLLEAFNVAQTDFSDETMRDIGLFSRMILDVETVYMSVDSKRRFSDVLNFLQNAADTGYDVSTDDVIQRPDAVTVSTVHKMKGLEFPCVFVVDVEALRFPWAQEQLPWMVATGRHGSGDQSRRLSRYTGRRKQTLLYSYDTRREVSLREWCREFGAGQKDLDVDPHTR